MSLKHKIVCLWLQQLRAGGRLCKLMANERKTPKARHAEGNTSRKQHMPYLNEDIVGEGVTGSR